MDVAALNLIERNTSSPLVERLVQEVRLLQDELAHRDVRIDDLEHEIAHLEDRLEELESLR